MKICEMGLMDIVTGIRVRALSDRDLLGTIVLFDPEDRFPSYRIEWDNGEQSLFFENQCECEVVEVPPRHDPRRLAHVVVLAEHRLLPKGWVDAPERVPNYVEWWKREIPPTLTPEQAKKKLEALRPFLKYRRCGYQMPVKEALYYVMEQGFKALEAERREVISRGSFKEAERDGDR